MSQKYASIQETHREFIAKQKMFFTASAAPTGRVNVSPKGYDTFRYINANEVMYLDLTGSGNETSAHIKACPDGRLTIMFCAFEGPPVILRLYGQGSVISANSERYDELIKSFEELPGSRQIIHLKIDLVQTSCGWGVPLYDYKDQRPTLVKHAVVKGEDYMKDYRAQKNMASIDGFPTGFEEREE